MRSLCLFLSLAAVVSAQDGSMLYKQKCASCHDMPQGRTPPLAAVKAMSGEAIYAALTTGTMKTQAQGLSQPQMAALIRYIMPTGGTPATPASLAPTCKGDLSFHPSPESPQWNGWSPSLTNSRFQEASAAGLTAEDVPKLKLKWAFNLGAVTMARSQPTVVGGRVFLGTQTGVLYSLDVQTGCTYWGFKAASSIRSGPEIAQVSGTPVIVFNDAGANVYAVNAESGKSLWKVRPAVHPSALATASPRVYQGVVYQTFSSPEEALGANPKYQCCTFRGSVVALDATTGRKLWETYAIPEAPHATEKNAQGTQEFGPSGAAIWSPPTIDEKLGALYVATGDNYSAPASATSDAVLAMDLKTGKLLWSRQFTRNDIFNNSCSNALRVNCPPTPGPDADFGQPPILVSLAEGKRALVIGQKSGMAYAIDPDQKGALLWQTRAGQGGTFGGSQWGSASDGKLLYVAISGLAVGAVADAKQPQGFRLAVSPKTGGGLHALDLATGKIVWSAQPQACPANRTGCSPAQSAAVTAIPGAVFSGSVDGHLRAYSSLDGHIIWDTDTDRQFDTVNGKPAHGGSLDAAGPTIAGGMVLVNSGYGLWGGMPGNVLLAFSVEGR